MPRLVKGSPEAKMWGEEMKKKKAEKNKDIEKKPVIKKQKVLVGQKAIC